MILEFVTQIGRHPFVAACGACCIVLIVALLAGTKTGAPPPIAKPFLTKRERAMLDALERVLPMYRIHAQVAMGAILKAPARLGKRSTPADRNRFAQKIVDFLIFNPANGEVIALVELDDYSHDADKDRARDRMTARAGYETIRIPATARPTTATARAAVAYLLQDAPPDALVAGPSR